MFAFVSQLYSQVKSFVLFKGKRGSNKENSSGRERITCTATEC